METHEQYGTTNEEREYYSLSARVYSKLAPFYDLTVYGIRRLRREVAALTEVGAGSRVLDVATGTGEAALAFAENGAAVVGIDPSEAMLRVTRRKNRFRKLSFVRRRAVAALGRELRRRLHLLRPPRDARERARAHPPRDGSRHEAGR